MGLTKKTAERWRELSREQQATIKVMGNIEATVVAVDVLEEAAGPRRVTRLEVLAAAVVETIHAPSDDPMVGALRFIMAAGDAGLIDVDRQEPTKRGADLLRRVREAAATGRLPKPRRAG